MQPRLILLDEPFGALDQQTRLLMGDEVLRLWRETGATVFLITHALDEAAMLADRIGVMSARPGTLIDVVETGWPRERDSRIVERREFRRDHQPAVEDAARGIDEDHRAAWRQRRMKPRHALSGARDRRLRRAARGAVPRRRHRQDHDAAAAPDRARLLRMLVVRAALSPTIAQDAGQRAASRSRSRSWSASSTGTVLHGYRTRARHARSAVRHLLRDPGVRVLSAVHRDVRARRRAAGADRLHARRRRGDRHHAQRPRPRAARAAQDRADQPAGAAADGAAA